MLEVATAITYVNHVDSQVGMTGLILLNCPLKFRSLYHANHIKLRRAEVCLHSYVDRTVTFPTVYSTFGHICSNAQTPHSLFHLKISFTNLSN